MIRTFLAFFFLVAASLPAGRAFGGQDFPFFLCVSGHASLGTFVVGTADETPTGYALWTRDDDGRWQMSNVTINKKASSYALSGLFSATRERFEVEIPFSCGARCDGVAAIGAAQSAPTGIVCARLDADGAAY